MEKLPEVLRPIPPRKIPNYKSISPREHPRLIFRQNQLPKLREKAKTFTGKAIQPWILVLLPFFQAYENVVGQDLVTDSSVEWFLSHYVMRIVGEKGEISFPSYGRHL